MSIFPRPDGVTQRYDRIAAVRGVETTLHKLRHYSATELLAAGVDVRTVTGRLGHSGGGTTTLRTYTAWDSEADQRAATGLSQRALEALPRLRADHADEVSKDGLVLRGRPAGGGRFWTWASLKVNATLLAGLGLDADAADAADNESVLLSPGCGAAEIRSASTEAAPQLGDAAATALKFSTALPPGLAALTLGQRLADPAGAAAAMRAPLTVR